MAVCKWDHFMTFSYNGGISVVANSPGMSQVYILTLNMNTPSVSTF